jgi:hypothetical protein
MKSEMDLLRMDERQRLAWLMANRGTVVAVGAIWTAMIVWELAHGRAPLFLIVMVPVFALLRVGLYFFYSRTPQGLGGEGTPGRFGLIVKITAAVLLLLAIFLPLYSVDDSKNGYPWQLVADDPVAAIPLAFAFLWPVAVLLVSRRLSGRTPGLILHVLEPLIAAASSIVILWIPQMIFEFQLFIFVPVPLPVRAAIGCYMAVTANGLYVVGWLSEFLRPRVIGAASAGV